VFKVNRMKVSVIVPVRNEGQSIRTLLESLLGQTRVPDEIVITDGGSTDATMQIIEEYIRRGGAIKLIRETAALPGRGRNLAAAEASCEWLAFIDGGIEPVSDWLAALVDRAQQASVDVVYGAWEPVLDSFFKECAALAYVPPPTPVEGGVVRSRFIASSLMRREVWRAVGGFPENLRSGEDIIFMERIERANFRMAREPRAMVRWNIQPNLWRTFRRFVTYARHNIRAGLWREWQAALLHYYLLIAILASPTIVLGPKWLLVAAVFWLLLMAGRGVIALRRNRHSYPAGNARNALRLLLLIPIIATLDAAALVGSASWLLFDRVLITRELNTADDT
jgi:glycosyltransferase involved in cell wall biosynthesis